MVPSPEHGMTHIAAQNTNPTTSGQPATGTLPGPSISSEPARKPAGSGTSWDTTWWTGPPQHHRERHDWWKPQSRKRK
eukprot:5710472-Prorocentrum_lima.AAC.1